MNIKSVHRTFDEKAPGKRELTLHVSDGESVKSYSGAKALSLIEDWKPGPVRFSDVKSADSVLLALHERGAQILHAHWHKTGIAKGTTPQGIAKAIALLPDEMFREFVPDANIAKLRNAVAMRDALMRYYGDCSRRLLQAARNMGTASREDIVDESLIQAFSDLDEARSEFPAMSETGRAISWETRVANIAKTIPQCQVFARVAHVESMGSAAAVVSAINGIERFESVAGLWRFCGQHVVEGKSPKRAKGVAGDWCPNAKKALYLLGVAIMKNRSNSWNAIYRQIKEQELAVHEQKHPGCKTQSGHCDAMARRRVIKEILKRFYLEAKGEKFVDRCSVDPQITYVDEPQPATTKEPERKLAAANIDSLDRKTSEAHQNCVEERRSSTVTNPANPLTAADINFPDQVITVAQGAFVGERHPIENVEAINRVGAT